VPLYRAAAMLLGALPWDALHRIADELADLDARVPGAAAGDARG